MEDALKIFGKDPATNPAFTDKVKSDRLRKAFDSLTRSLIDRIESLNENQMLFLCTGALADQVDLGEGSITLLDRGIYDALLEAYRDVPSKLPEQADYVYTAWDRARMIAADELYALDPQQAGKRRPKKEAADPSQDPKLARETAIGRRNACVKDLEAAMPSLQKLFEAAQTVDSTAAGKALECMKSFTDQAGGRAPEAVGSAKMDLDREVLNAAPTLKTYAEAAATNLLKIRQLAEKYGPVLAELRKTLREIEALNAVKTDSMRKRFVTFDIDRVAKIKTDFGYTGGFVAATAENSANRVATSSSRVLLNSHLNMEQDPLRNQLCTPENVHAAMQKILAVHVNAFPKSPSGAFQIPPVIIEPVRNVVDWLEDRFIMSAVSGEIMRKGPHFSLSPLEAQVMKAIGMYLSKDSIYNFRGEQNAGTFMGDYSGKVEKSAKVVFAGADKKMTMVASAKQVDAAGREQAVSDYIEFVFNVLNGLMPNPKMSKRRIAVLLRYVIIKDLQFTVILMLRYAAMTELQEVRESLMKHVQNNYNEAKRLVEESWNDEQVPRVLGPKPTQFMQKMFG
ncbi:MAG TPA: hypothetical protein VK914_09745 [bacterium]|nr:hypothetical protein [bacterium]